MKKYIGLFALGAFLVSQVTYAQGSDLQTQINALLAQLQSLQAEQVALQSGQFCHAFNVNLGAGSRNSGDVVALHQALQKEGFSVSAEEVKGRVFAGTTAAAVTAFQEKYRSDILAPFGLARGTGFVGLATRTKLNILYGCGAPQFAASGTLTGKFVEDMNGNGVFDVGTDRIIQDINGPACGKEEVRESGFKVQHKGGEALPNLCNPEAYYSIVLPAGAQAIQPFYPEGWTFTGSVPRSANIVSGGMTQVWFFAKRITDRGSNGTVRGLSVQHVSAQDLRPFSVGANQVSLVTNEMFQGTIDNPYSFSLPPGKHTIYTTAPLGFTTLGYTLCKNGVSCHSETPKKGSSMVISIEPGTAYDLWWHFAPTLL